MLISFQNTWPGWNGLYFENISVYVNQAMANVLLLLHVLHFNVSIVVTDITILIIIIEYT